MSQASTHGTPVAPMKELLRGTAIAAVLAGIILMVAVLPAEYGIDPTGAGKMLGLTAIHSPAVPVSNGAVAPAIPVVIAPAVTPGKIAESLPKGSTVSAPGEVRALTIASKQELAYRSDVMEVTLPAGKGLEVKTHLAKGATLIYSWKTANGEVLNHDFHGEPVNARNDEFESFILEDDVSQSKGSLIAPFTGVHGWYWKNKTAAPVKVVLHASGFYSSIFKK